MDWQYELTVGVRNWTHCKLTKCMTTGTTLHVLVVWYDVEKMKQMHKTWYMWTSDCLEMYPDMTVMSEMGTQNVHETM